MEWDPEFLFKTIAFSAFFNITADPYQQTNIWSTQSASAKAAWRAELAAEFLCHGHHGKSSDCS